MRHGKITHFSGRGREKKKRTFVLRTRLLVLFPRGIVVARASIQSNYTSFCVCVRMIFSFHASCSKIKFDRRSNDQMIKFMKRDPWHDRISAAAPTTLPHLGVTARKWEGIKCFWLALFDVVLTLFRKIAQVCQRWCKELLTVAGRCGRTLWFCAIFLLSKQRRCNTTHKFRCH